MVHLVSVLYCLLFNGLLGWFEAFWTRISVLDYLHLTLNKRKAKGNTLLAVTWPIQIYLFAVNLEFWHLSPKFFKRPMALYRNNKYIPKKSNIHVLSLIKIAIFNLSTTANHPCDELFANANFWSLCQGRLSTMDAQWQQYPVYGRCIWQITMQIWEVASEAWSKRPITFYF